jgi:DNA-binding beta-propeller fold protein YncE
MTNRPILLLPLIAALLAACSEDVVCPVGEVECGGRCVSVLSDDANCGACGNACGAQEACVAGTCSCGPDTTACGDACADLRSDPDHCGDCGTTCAGTDVCSTSACGASCGDGLTPCDRACVDLDADRYHCGACGHACGAGETCTAGTCQALQVACFATDDVRPVSADLSSVGPARAAGTGPIALTILAGHVYAANSLSTSISVLPLDARLTGTEKVLEGNDFEYVAGHEGILFVANSGGGTVIVWDPARDRVLDELVFADRTDTNPRAIAFTGARAFVPLYGKDETTGGQGIGVVELSDLASCVAATGEARPPCGTVEKVIDLRANAAAFDAPGLPFPSRVAVGGGKVLVTLANLKKATTGPLAGWYVDPAGPGRLAVIDTTRDDALSIVPLGACQNPGAIAVNGAEAWVSCGGGDTPGLLRIDLSGAAPAPEAAVRPIADLGLGAPGNLAFCGGMGYVTDLWSGTVLRFDPTGAAAPSTISVCPASEGPFGYAWAADVACAP